MLISQLQKITAKVLLNGAINIKVAVSSPLFTLVFGEDEKIFPVNQINLEPASSCSDVYRNNIWDVELQCFITNFQNFQCWKQFWNTFNLIWDILTHETLCGVGNILNVSRSSVSNQGKLQREVILAGGSRMFARFGSAIGDIGDINQDSINGIYLV